MTDAAHYFLAHARDAIRKARQLDRGAWRNRQRRVARVYHLLAKQAFRGAPAQAGKTRLITDRRLPAVLVTCGTAGAGEPWHDPSSSSRR